MSDEEEPLTKPDHARIAREALEQVCSGERLADAADYYSDHFVDHVNGKEYRGLDGVRQSVGLYQQLLQDLRFEVLQQVAEGDSVASRIAVHGIHRGRRIRLTAIVISRIESGKIIEDFVASDPCDLVRQLGLWRSALFVITHPQVLRSSYSAV